MVGAGSPEAPSAAAPCAREAADATAADASREGDSVGIVGLGLIGGSFAKAFAYQGERVLGFDSSEATLSAAVAEGTLAGPLDAAGIARCKLIIVALYAHDTVAWLEEHAAEIPRTCLVIDCGGVKRPICPRAFELADEHGFAFLGAHPMAGTQFSGYAHARVDLFDGQPMVLVPPVIYSPDLIALAQRLLAPAGFGSFSVTSPEEHDRIIAFSSQLAHVVSSAYVKSPTASRHRGFSAGSYRDLTRVAEMNAAMWSEHFLENADNLRLEIASIRAELARYDEALAQGDREALVGLIEEGTARKRSIDGRGRIVAS